MPPAMLALGGYVYDRGIPVEQMHPDWRGETVRVVRTDDPTVLETLARVIENRHGTLHGIGDTLREALAELKRGAR